jgi:hypothetical protein
MEGYQKCICPYSGACWRGIDNKVVHNQWPSDGVSKTNTLIIDGLMEGYKNACCVLDGSVEGYQICVLGNQ